MDSLFLIGLSIGSLALGSALSLAVSRDRRWSGWVSTVFVVVAALAIWVLVVDNFAGTKQVPVSLMALPTLGAHLTLFVDPLSAFFLAIVMTIAVLATLYSVEYMTHYKKDAVAKFYPVLLIFFIGIIGVLVVSDLLFFLVFWELMTLASFFLVVFERESAASQRAGLKYFVITHAATLCMVAAALILRSYAESFDFGAMRVALATLLDTRPFLGHFVIFLFVMGFATKAGVLPMGDWLPDAHPVAPTGMSAVLSGALVKLGIYGLVRLFCTFVPVSGSLEGWGMVLALAGTVSLFSGTLTALKQTDSKRLMAFHTIGQIGYICLGLGVGFYCLPSHPVLGVLGLMGGLFHAANHACFKACLFLGAGSVLYRTGERDMNKLGGLATFMPATTGTTTVAALSIAGVPPFNGFTSKWLIVVTCLVAGMESGLFLVFGLTALFISLVTLASFLKVLGAVFLGLPSTKETVREVPWAMVLPQGVLAALCVLMGVFPKLPLAAIRDVVAGVSHVPVPGFGTLMGEGWGIRLTVEGSLVASWAPLVVLFGITLLGLLAYGIQRAGRAQVRQVPVWTCGEVHDAATVRYQASSFYLPFKHAVQGVYPELRVQVPRFPTWLRRVFELDRWLWSPVVQLFKRGATGLGRTHVGTPQVYLLWTVLGAVLVVGIMLICV